MTTYTREEVNAWGREEWDAVLSGEPGMVDISSIRPKTCTALALWDDEFALFQLERMMRADPELTESILRAQRERASMNPCVEIPLGPSPHLFARAQPPRPQRLLLAQGLPEPHAPQDCRRPPTTTTSRPSPG